MQAEQKRKFVCSKKIAVYKTKRSSLEF